jgi:hypothetical protein
MTVKKSIEIAQRAVDQYGIKRGAQLSAFMKGIDYAKKYGDWYENNGVDGPDYGEEVLCFCIDGCYGIGHLDANPYIDGWVVNGKIVSDDYVTHWMSLPNGPDAPND